MINTAVIYFVWVFTLRVRTSPGVFHREERRSRNACDTSMAVMPTLCPLLRNESFALLKSVLFTVPTIGDSGRLGIVDTVVAFVGFSEHCLRVVIVSAPQTSSSRYGCSLFFLSFFSDYRIF